MKTQNKLSRPLSKAEDMALERAAEILEAAFGKRMFYATVNANKHDDKDPFGVAFAFDMREEDSQD